MLFLVILDTFVQRNWIRRLGSNAWFLGQIESVPVSLVKTQVRCKIVCLVRCVDILLLQPIERYWNTSEAVDGDPTDKAPTISDVWGSTPTVSTTHRIKTFAVIMSNSPKGTMLNAAVAP